MDWLFCPARLVSGELSRGELHRVNVEGCVWQRSFLLCYHRSKVISDTLRRFWTLPPPTLLRRPLPNGEAGVTCVQYNKFFVFSPFISIFL